MRGRYEDKRRIGALMGLGMQCRATTGRVCDHDINNVTHMTTKEGIPKVGPTKQYGEAQRTLY